MMFYVATSGQYFMKLPCEISGISKVKDCCKSSMVCKANHAKLHHEINLSYTTINK